MAQDRYPGELIEQRPSEPEAHFYRRLVEAHGPEPEGLRTAARDAVNAARSGVWVPTETDREIAWTVIEGLQWTDDRPLGPSFAATEKMFAEALAADLSEPMGHLLRAAAQWEPKLADFGAGSWGESLAAIARDDFSY